MLLNQLQCLFKKESSLKKQLMLSLMAALPVVVNGQGCPQVVASGDTVICATATGVQLNASAGFESYSWSPGTLLNDSTIANPIATIGTTTTFVVTAVAYSAIPNGDFSQGNTGFTSELIYTSTYSPGNYYVGPSFFNLPQGNYPDHTPTADNYFMSIDGSTTSTVIWESTASVLPNENYQFNFWSTRAGTIQPIFEIHFIGNVTGDVIVSTITGIPSNSIWIWDQYGPPVWNSGPNTSLTIRIRNLETNGFGNDFALDDFTLIGPCFSTDTITVVAQPGLVKPVVTDTTICRQSAPFVPTATGQDLLWYENYPGTGVAAPQMDASNVDTLTLFVTQSANGCESDTAAFTLTITAPLKPVVTYTAICTQSSPFVPTATGQDLLWYENYPGTGVAAPQMDASNTDTLTLFVTQSDNGCESDPAAFTLAINAPPVFNMPDEAKICDGITTVIGPPFHSGWTYSWSDGVTVSPRIISQTGMYTLTVSNECGSASEFCDVLPEDCSCYFYMPNAITPNGDEFNEQFVPVFRCDFDTYLIEIYNRWGEVVFSSSDPRETWDGVVDGIGYAPDNVYVWKVQFSDNQTTEIRQYTGHVTVLK